MGILIKNKDIVVDEEMKTNVKNIYAGGDCTSGVKQIAKAVYDGMQAALSIIKEIRSERNE